MYIESSSFLNFYLRTSRSPHVTGVELLGNDALAHSLFYADDVALLADSVVAMQRKIQVLAKFCDEWGLKVNTDKSKMMVFRNCGCLRQTENWLFNDKKLEVSTYYNYLGVTFSSRLCYSKCTDNHACKARRALQSIRKIFSNLDEIKLDIAAKIIDVRIKPILLYGSEIWGTKIYECIEHV